MLLIIMGPGLIVMVGDNDAGAVATYSQAGQDYGMALAWTLALLIPVLYVNQEMVLRLGAVSGVGHAKLIFERFGKFWGWFSVGDLFILNTLTIVTEFIGVTLAIVVLRSPEVHQCAGGGGGVVVDRRGRLVPPVGTVAVRAHRGEHLRGGSSGVVSGAPPSRQITGGLVPQFPGGLNSTLLLLIVAIVGTTVAPWQLFFQQSNVVDKRITPRWIGYARTDLCIGIAVVMFGGITLMAASTFAFAGTGDFGNFTDSGAVATGLSDRVGHTVGALFALLLLNASLVGANAVGLATTYTLGDTFNRRHSLHWKITQAPLFYAGYAVVLTVSAAVALSPDAVLGLLTLGVQALAGVLLPSASVFLVLLCNDKPVLGPWVNTVRQNIIASSIVWILVLLSLALTAATFFPDLTTSTYIDRIRCGRRDRDRRGRSDRAVSPPRRPPPRQAGRRRARRPGPRPARRPRGLGHRVADPERTEGPDRAGPGHVAHPGAGHPGTAGDVAAAQSGVVHLARLPDRGRSHGDRQNRPNRHRRLTRPPRPVSRLPFRRHGVLTVSTWIVLEVLR